MTKQITLKDANANEFVKTFKQLTTSRAVWQVWADFISMFAIAISNRVDKKHFEVREKEYLKIQSGYFKSEMDVIVELFCIIVMALEKDMWQDFLGSLYMRLELGNHWKGQFFTPYDITKMMAKISVGGDLYEAVKEKGYISVNDCACGAGATLIAFAEAAYNELSVKHGLNWQNHVLFTAQDIDPVTAKMCYIQLSLLGCAGFIKIGDTLSDPMQNGDDDTNYWYTPMYFSEIWQLRRVWHSMDEACAVIKKEHNISDTSKGREEDEADTRDEIRDKSEVSKPVGLNIDFDSLFD